jgi:hypothetical protein
LRGATTATTEAGRSVVPDSRGVYPPCITAMQKVARTPSVPGKDYVVDVVVVGCCIRVVVVRMLLLAVINMLHALAAWLVSLFRNEKGLAHKLHGSFRHGDKRLVERR